MAAPESETTGGGHGWVTDVPKAVEQSKRPVAPILPYLGPVATTIDPPPALATETSEPVTAPIQPLSGLPLVQEETTTPTALATEIQPPPAEPVTAGLQPLSVQPPGKVEMNTANTPQTPQANPRQGEPVYIHHQQRKEA